MKRLFTIVLTFLTCFCLFAQNKTSVYVSSHPDDWQLFMNPNAYNSIKNSNEKVLFLHTTAGDAGAGVSNTRYLAREEGSLRAIRFMSNTFTTGAGLGTNMNETIVNINGHQILKYTYRNAVAYFLRLPDGSPNGSGYSREGFRSLQRLFNGAVSNISAIDNSTTYNSLSDLENTLRTIVELESASLNNLNINVGDDDIVINPGDHSDHIYSSKIMQNIAHAIGGVTVNLYTEYETGSRPQNVFNHDFLVSAGTWGVTTSGLADNSTSSTWDNTHNSWVGKQYYRTVTTPVISNEINIALNKPTSSSSNELNSLSSEANDNNYSVNNNYWGASPFSQWWQVDLEDIYDVNEIVIINYYDGQRYYQYDVQASIDGVNWVEIVDFNNNTTPSNSLGNTFDSLNATARYLRVNMNFNSANIGVHIVEFEAYGEKLSSAVSARTAVNGIVGGADLLVYPNPVKKGDDVVIDLGEPVSGAILIDVYDFEERSVVNEALTEDITTNTIRLNTSAFSLGLNVVNITFGEKKVTKNVYVK